MTKTFPDRKLLNGNLEIPYLRSGRQARLMSGWLRRQPWCWHSSQAAGRYLLAAFFGRKPSAGTKPFPGKVWRFSVRPQTTTPLDCLRSTDMN